MKPIAVALSNGLSAGQLEQLRAALTTSAGPVLLTWLDREVLGDETNVLTGTRESFEKNQAVWIKSRRIRDFFRQVIGLDVVEVMKGTL